MVDQLTDSEVLFPSVVGAAFTCDRDFILTLLSAPRAREAIAGDILVCCDSDNMIGEEDCVVLGKMGFGSLEAGPMGGNMSSLEGVLSVLAALHTTLRKSGAEYVLKIDADTLIFDDAGLFISAIDQWDSIAVGFARTEGKGFKGACYALHRSVFQFFGVPVEGRFSRGKCKERIERLDVKMGGKLLGGSIHEDKLISAVIDHFCAERMHLIPDGHGFTRSDYKRPDWQDFEVVEYGQRHMLDGDPHQKTDRIFDVMRRHLHEWDSTRSDWLESID